jgi:hypothetical protein
LEQAQCHPDPANAAGLSSLPFPLVAASVGTFHLLETLLGKNEEGSWQPEQNAPSPMRLLPVEIVGGKSFRRCRSIHTSLLIGILRGKKLESME